MIGYCSFYDQCVHGVECPLKLNPARDRTMRITIVEDFVPDCYVSIPDDSAKEITMAVLQRRDRENFE